MSRVPPPIRVTSDRVGASYKDQQKIIVDGSPLAIIGIFLAILRERYTTGNGPTEYPWTEDPNTTRIIIESAFEDTHAVRGKRPAIYIDKDESIYGRNIIGDRVAHRFTNAKDWQWCLSSVPIIMNCVASRRGESAIIGDITQWTIHCASDAIQKIFALHDISPPTLGRTVPFEGDKESWTSPVSFTVQYNVRWATVPIRPLLQQIILRISESGQCPEDYLIEIASHAKSTNK